MVPHTDGGKRLTMMNVDELNALLKDGKAVQKGQALWEVLEDGEVSSPKPQQPASKPAQAQAPAVAKPPQGNHSHKPHPHTAGKKQGSKTK
jgi:hypothetical protein